LGVVLAEIFTHHILFVSSSQWNESQE